MLHYVNKFLEFVPVNEDAYFAFTQGSLLNAGEGKDTLHIITGYGRSSNEYWVEFFDQESLIWKKGKYIEIKEDALFILDPTTLIKFNNLYIKAFMNFMPNWNLNEKYKEEHLKPFRAIIKKLTV